MYEVASSAQIFLSVLALLIAGVSLVGVWRQAKIAYGQEQVAINTANLAALKELHIQKTEALESNIAFLEAEIRRHERHVDHCEAELARFRALLARHGIREDGV